MKEEWVGVLGWEEFYEVSSLGRVKSLDRVICGPRGGVSTRLGRVLRPAPNTGGYPVVVLCKNGHQKTKMVHILVLCSFVGPRPDGFEACHNNGNKSDNRLINLRWDTPENNRLDIIKHGGYPTRVGSSNPMAKLSENDIPKILEMASNGLKNTEISCEFGVSPSTISHIIHGRKWSHSGIVGKNTEVIS